jgi:membrane-associated protease RseP (regulator of RpoE activity)
VDVDEDQLKKAKHKSSFRVMAAGVAGNAAVAAACLVGVLLIVGSLTPVIDGVYISSVTAGMPAQAAGLLPKDVLVSIDGVRVNDTKILKDLLGNKTGGEVVSVTVARGENWQDRFTANVTLVSTENGTMMGVAAGNLATQERLSSYQAITWQKLAMYLVPPTLASGLVPFSDSLSPFYSSVLGSEWPIFANVLFWLWFVNFNVAMFNALPIYPLDGGRMFNIGLKATLGKKLSERAISITTYVVSAVCLAIVVLIAVLPFIR